MSSVSPSGGNCMEHLLTASEAHFFALSGKGNGSVLLLSQLLLPSPDRSAHSSASCPLSQPG
jgi:hypothetical protein